MPIAYFTGILNREAMLAFFAVALLFSMLLSVLAVLLDDIAFRRHAGTRDLALLTLASILENLGYRQITAWWRVCAFWEYWRGQKTWGQMERRGLSRA